MKKILMTVALAATMGITTIYAQTQDSTSNQQNGTAAASTQAAAPSGDVVQAISQSGYNTTMVSAIKTAGLENTLNSGGLIRFLHLLIRHSRQAQV
ncbi:hypothetical protein [Arcticibacter sp. MXS-1]|uniref:hypothetical protein n=1 Tax=Arcticibacter sp. MXS-1 TaxID=3341726 RepID=UPI0035A8BE70